VVKGPIPNNMNPRPQLTVMHIRRLRPSGLNISKMAMAVETPTWQDYERRLGGNAEPEEALVKMETPWGLRKTRY